MLWRTPFSTYTRTPHAFIPAGDGWKLACTGRIANLAISEDEYDSRLRCKRCLRIVGAASRKLELQAAWGAVNA